MRDMVTELIEAIKAGDGDRVAELLTSDPALLAAKAPNGVSAILLAMYHGKPAVARLFIERGAVLDLHEAAAVGDLQRVRALATAENVNSASADGFQPLGLACYFGQDAVAAYLIRLGADVNQAAENAMKVRPIHAATARRSVALVRLLLESGADPNARQQMGYTALHAAHQNGDRDIIELLIAHGADADVRTDDGRRPSDLPAAT